MNRTYIKDLTEGQCKIKGMVETIRDKKIMFLVIRDVTGSVQVTVEKDKCPDVYEQAKELTPHSFVTVEGQCVFSTYVRNGQTLKSFDWWPSIRDVRRVDVSNLK